MNVVQKKIAVITLAILAFFFHTVFCDSKKGNQYQETRTPGSPDGLIIPTGSSAGIFSRSPDTHSFDAIAGVALPVVFIGLGLFILAGPSRDDSDVDQSESKQETSVT